MAAQRAVHPAGDSERASYWRSVVRFGLPFTFFCRVIDYFISRATTGVWFRYSFWSEVTIDVAIVLAVSTLHWKRSIRRSAENTTVRPPGWMGRP